MRSNTKMKKMLIGHELRITYDEEEISMIVSNIEDRTDFMVTGKSISDIFNKAYSTWSKNKKTPKRGRVEDRIG